MNIFCDGPDSGKHRDQLPEFAYSSVHSCVCALYIDAQDLSIALNDSKLEGMWEEVVMAHFETLTWHLFGKIEEDNWKSESG
jgi:hypothetical protein